LKNAQDQLVLYRQAVKPHQDHGQVLQDEEDIMVINFSDEVCTDLIGLLCILGFTATANCR
jgi:hypothetical protein